MATILLVPVNRERLQEMLDEMLQMCFRINPLDEDRKELLKIVDLLVNLLARNSD
jgi:hypothetical protein